MAQYISALGRAALRSRPPVCLATWHNTVVAGADLGRGSSCLGQRLRQPRRGGVQCACRTGGGAARSSPIFHISTQTGPKILNWRLAGRLSLADTGRRPDLLYQIEPLVGLLSLWVTPRRRSSSRSLAGGPRRRRRHNARPTPMSVRDSLARRTGTELACARPANWPAPGANNGLTQRRPRRMR